MQQKTLIWILGPILPHTVFRLKVGGQVVQKNYSQTDCFYCVGNEDDVCVSEGTSQFGFLELSQSQDLRGEVENSQVQDGDVVPQSGTGAKLGTKMYL